MTTVLDALHMLGRATWEPVWIPIIAWTVFALPLWVGLKRTRLLHPYGEYRLWQMLLATLPLGLMGALVIDTWGPTTPLSFRSDLSVLVLPPINASAGSATTPTVGWIHFVGTLTLSAITTGLIRLGQLVAHAVALVRARSTVEGRSLPEAIEPTVDRLTNLFGVDRPVNVRVCSQVAVPVTIGGLRPLVLLPSTLVDHSESLRLTLAHEFVHVRRYDDLAHIVERLIAAVFSIHPLVGQLRDQIVDARERACDAAVLAVDEASVGTYARLLVNFADDSAPRRLGALTLSESPSSLTDRLHAMKSSVTRWISSPFSLIVSLLTVGILVTVGVVACSDSIAPTSPDQTTTSEPAATAEPSDEIFVVVEQQPDCGGVEALSKHLQYPEIAREAGIEGRVFVQFIVNENGEVVEPTVTKGVHEALDQAALAAVQELECKPGKQRGEPVKVRMALPVTFKLPGKKTTDENSPSGSVEIPGTGDDPSIQGGVEALQEQLFYPDLVRKAGIEGTVRVTFTVTENGTVENARVSKSVHDDLDAAALKAVQSVSFVPPTTNGSATTKEVTLPITFTLPEG